MSFKYALISSLLCLGVAGVEAKPASAVSLDLKSFFTDTIDTISLRKSVLDYGIKSDPNLNQSAALQSAINDLSRKGGGVLSFPKGEYRFAKVAMCSNVHLVIDKDAFLYPAMNDEHIVTMLQFNIDPLTKKVLKNASIRCAQEGEQYTVDFQLESKTNGWKMIFANVGLVKNFMVSDFKLIDNFSNHCSMNVASGAGDLSAYEVDRSTDGEISNCTHINAHPGYGLVQIHSANRIYCEDLSTVGGVTLRLETGAKNARGVMDIHAKNLTNLNGRSALMLAPHRMKNGTVKVDGITTYSCETAVAVGSGHDDGKDERGNSAAAGEAEQIGSFASDSVVVNVHGVYGENACIKGSATYVYKPGELDKARFADISAKMNGDDSNKWLFGPTHSVVSDRSDGLYTVTFKNVTAEGFPFANPEIVRPDAAMNAREDKRFYILKNWESGRAIQTLSTALDNTELTFTTHGGSEWFGQTVRSADGVDAAQSGLIYKGEESILETTVSGYGEISFDWGVSAASNLDKVIFLVDGVEKARISKDVKFENAKFALGDGPHKLTWKYEKDSSEFAPLDCGWVDKVKWVKSDKPIIVPDPDPKPTPDPNPDSPLVTYKGGKPSEAVQNYVNSIAKEPIEISKKKANFIDMFKLAEIPAGEITFDITEISIPERDKVKIRAMPVNKNGALVFDTTKTLSLKCQLLGSEDLKNWEEIATRPLNEASHSVLFNLSQEKTRRYYRIAVSK